MTNDELKAMRNELLLPLWRHEFPDHDGLPAVEGFEDISWHNR